MIDLTRLQTAYASARGDLLSCREPAGHWVGRLSSSALSTATAVSALSLYRRGLVEHDSSPAVASGQTLDRLIERGLAWIEQEQLADGGWGDTDLSLANIATTMLCQAALVLGRSESLDSPLMQRAARYVEQQGGLAGLRRRYGRDKTFAVPILTNCALAGLVPWREVSPLPFELACFPQAWFRFLRLPVVSYAIPALVAIGQVRFVQQPPWDPLRRLVRGLAIRPSLRVLEQIQPASGGFLEATPLTSFVVMSLLGSGQGDHPVVHRGLKFLLESVREDGSWPIDTNLATWNTTLALNALAAVGTSNPADQAVARQRSDETGAVAARGEAHDTDSHPTDRHSADRVDALSQLPVDPACWQWLLRCQYRQVHPYTGAAPGGWGWSDLSGAVPDADDTPGALLALAHGLRRGELRGPLAHQARQAAALGIGWLLDLQNGDGGWPTFCRGWGTMPFDRSGADLTAHALRALAAWRELLPVAVGASPAIADPPGSQAAERIDRAIRRGLDFLDRNQRADGSWVPLWFGNQDHPAEENPVYGTARVLFAYADLGILGASPVRRGVEWLLTQQRNDGGWGSGPRAAAAERNNPGSENSEDSSIEESALAVEALAAVASNPDLGSRLEPALQRGVERLVLAVEANSHSRCSPIGFYFAKLWYYEQLYPVILMVAALGRALHWWGCRQRPAVALRPQVPSALA